MYDSKFDQALQYHKSLLFCVENISYMQSFVLNQFSKMTPSHINIHFLLISLSVILIPTITYYDNERTPPNLCTCGYTFTPFLLLSQQEDAIDIQTTWPVNRASLVFWLQQNLPFIVVENNWATGAEPMEGDKHREGGSGNITVDPPSALQVLGKGLTLVIVSLW